MGGRGRGGISKIPASLQAKMDAVSYLQCLFRVKLTSRWLNDHRTQVYHHLVPNNQEVERTPTQHPWQPSYGLRLFDNSPVEDQICLQEEVVLEPDPKEHQDKVDLHSPDLLPDH
jgi:hypothetical protein